MDAMKARIDEWLNREVESVFRETKFTIDETKRYLYYFDGSRLVVKVVEVFELERGDK